MNVRRNTVPGSHLSPRVPAARPARALADVRASLPMTGPGYAVGQLLSDPTLLGMALLSTCVVHLGVWRATGFGKARPTHSVRGRTAASLDSPEFATLLGGPLVALVPFAAAMILVCLFLFMKQLGPVLIVLAAGAGVVSIGFLLWPLSARCLRSLGCARWDKLVTGMGATLVVAAWMFTGSWILNNVLAISLCVMITSFVRAGSLRVLSLLMGGLLCYDVVFVFVSPYMFGGRNVMVDVATAEPRNPFGVVSEALHLPSHAVQSLAFPGKLVLPVGGSATGTYTLLGLGDGTHERSSPFASPIHAACWL
jgi:hypothetical protein